MKKILIIQTAFIGDVILATPLIETLNHNFSGCQIDFMVKKGNEGLLVGHPLISHIYSFDKENKARSLFTNISEIRREKYDLVVNLQRFASSGIIAGFSGGKKIIGFKKNPISWLFSQKFDHSIGDGAHEVDRNLSLIESFCHEIIRKPRLYPTQENIEKIHPLISTPFICLAPASVWKTKEAPLEKWLEVISAVAHDMQIYLVGAPNDKELCEDIRSKSGRSNIENLCGRLTLIETASLFSFARRVYVNDSGPLHIASAMNTPVTAFFCSTVPDFGFGPLSDDSKIFEVENLACRPCGFHGKTVCPEGHFKCGKELTINV